MDWIWKKYWKKSMLYPWPWKYTVKVTFYFLNVFYVFSASNYVRKPSLNSAYTRNEIWPWNRDFQGQGCLREFLNYFYVFSASIYTRKPSKNLAYIINKIWLWIGDLQRQGCLREFFCNFFHIQRVKLHRNTLSNLHEQ